ncbi:O-antigen ligase family protein [Emcibacter sp. SYSU 3D8]|uniref:O-antigen ligase family protein n=1 Tax=Emcibacter sp. SYSU 3D8 TaxID=3133969 RepID=UPI0031FEBD87
MDIKVVNAGGNKMSARPTLVPSELPSQLARPSMKYKEVSRRSLEGALPIATCLFLPLVQIKDLFYIYDIVTVYSIYKLGFPSVPYRGRSIGNSVRLLAIAVLLATLSSLVRTGFELRSIMYCAQYLLALIYFYCLFSNIAAGRLDGSLLAAWVIKGAVLAGAFGILHFVLLTVAPSAGNALYRGYLSLAGFSDRFYQLRYVAGVENTGVIRALGTWDVSTTFGGMMVLASAWLLYAKHITKSVRYSAFILLSFAVLASGSRHAWVIGLIVLFALVEGSRRYKLFVASCFVGGLALWVFLSATPDDLGGTSFSNQIYNRFERTVSSGLEDSSIQLRYVDGTSNFLLYIMKDPSVLVFGFGLNTDKIWFQSMDIAAFASERIDNYNWGFVSNGWLLILRNMGILGFVGLLGLFLSIRRLGRSAVDVPLLIAALLILSDNYAIQVARCFFMILAFLAVIAGDALFRLQNRKRVYPESSTHSPRSMGNSSVTKQEKRRLDRRS